MTRTRRGHSLSLAVTLALTTSCAHDQPLAPPPPAPVLAEVGAVTTPPEVASEPIPLADGPAILSAICTPIWAVHDDGSRRIACTTHGPYSRAGAPSTAPIGDHEGNPLEVCELVSISRGAFTKAGARELLLSFAECNEHNKPSAFVVLLASDEPGRYRTAIYENNFRIERCEKTRRPDGRDIFYCESNERAPTLGISTTYSVVDFGHTGKHIGSIATFMQSAINCAVFAPGMSGTMKRGFAWMSPPTFHTEAGTLVVELNRTYAPASPTLDVALGAECQKSNLTDGLGALPQPQRFVITIEPRGESYAVVERLLVDQWNREFAETFLRSKLPPVWPVGRK